MLSQNYFKILVLLLFLLSQVHTAFAQMVQKKCGYSIFRVNIFDGKNDSLRSFELYGKTASGEENLLYRTRKGSYFFTNCRETITKQKLILFQEIQGLDDKPEDTYGVLDANTLKMMVNPNDWPNGNQKQIKKLLGYQPPFVHGYTGGFFCCFKKNY